MKEAGGLLQSAKEMKCCMNSVEVARTALFSSVLAVVDVMAYKLTWPMLPPIFVTPFINCFIFGMSVPFTKHQWIMGLLASLMTILSTGGVLPGPYILLIYGFVFSTGMIKLSGAFTSVAHMFYGVFLAPLIFSVAPAKIVYDWLLAYLRSLAPAIAVMALVFIIGGALTAASGYKIALRTARALDACVIRMTEV
jgi:hypothetical protein